MLLCIEALQQDCFNNSDWQVLTQAASLEDATDVMTKYIKFCEENIVPLKTVKIFSFNKTWVTKELKTTIIKKNIAFNSANKTESKLIQAKFNKQIKVV